VFIFVEFFVIHNACFDAEMSVDSILYSCSDEYRHDRYALCLPLSAHI
jgi:hypothetical protein